MKKFRYTRIFIIVCFFLTHTTWEVSAQDASHYETATSEDSGDWGLLGLLGLVGLFGLRKKKSPDSTSRSERTDIR